MKLTLTPFGQTNRKYQIESFKKIRPKLRQKKKLNDQFDTF